MIAADLHCNSPTIQSSTTTTIYTLPNDKNSSCSNSNSSNNKMPPTSMNTEYEEFRPQKESSRSSSSPSLPWLMEYWSTSLMQTPLVESLLCPCNSESALRRSTMDEVSDSASFRRLRKVVASREMFDIDEEYIIDDTAADATAARNSRYPTKKATTTSRKQLYQSLRKSSILHDDSEVVMMMDEDDADSILAPKPLADAEEEDDPVVAAAAKGNDDVTREDAASSSSPPMWHGGGGGGTSFDDYSSRVLYSCESFDNFLRGGTKSNCNSNAVLLQPQQDYETLVMATNPTTIVPSSAPTRSSQQQRLQPPSSPSATTYTTISLTQSYMHDDSFTTMDDEDEDVDDEVFLERWNASTQKLFRGMPLVDESETTLNSTTSTNNNNNPFQTPKSSRRKRIEPPSLHIKKSKEMNLDHSAFKYLIRMRPQNYRLDDPSSSKYAGAEEEKYDGCDDDESDDYSLPSHLQLSSHMTFHEAFLRKQAAFAADAAFQENPASSARSSPPPSMPVF